MQMDTRWLVNRLDLRGKSIASLARAVGRDRAAMSRIVNGEQPLQLWMTPLIAAELGVSEAELLSRTGELSMPVLSAAPIIPWHSVGAFAMTKKPIEVSSSYERIIVPIDSETLIALRVEGDAMSALFPADSLVVADYSQKDLHDKEIGVFAVGDRSVIRRFHVQRRRTWLTTETVREGRGKAPEGEVGEVVGRVVAVPFLSRTA